MKTALLYTFWTGDDTEMLLKSLIHHRKHFDRVIISIQTESNTGNYAPIDSRLVDYKIRKELEFSTITYKPNLKLGTKENERIKHNDLIEAAKHLGCTHFVLSAADHFYPTEMIDKGKQIMLDESIDLIVTKMFTYYKHENWIVDPIEDYYMPFFHKLEMNTAIAKSAKYPVLVDPSVKINNCNNVYVMPEAEGLMHHFSMVRISIENKFKNAASSIRWTPEQVKTFIQEYKYASIGDEITYFGKRKIKLIEEKDKIML